MQKMADQVILDASLSVLCGGNLDWEAVYDFVDPLPNEEAETFCFHISDLESHLFILLQNLSFRMDSFHKKTSEQEQISLIQEGLQEILKGAEVEKVRSRNLSAWGRTSFGEAWKKIHKAIYEMKRACQ